MRRAHALLGLVVMAVPWAGCAGGESTGHPPGPVAFDDVVPPGSDSGVDERRTVAVRSDDEWRLLWDEHASNVIPPPERPTIDFSAQMVVAVFKGESPNGCHGALVTGIEFEPDTAEGDRLVVSAEWITYNAICTQQVTHPFHMVKLDHIDAPARFDTAETQREPPPEP